MITQVFDKYLHEPTKRMRSIAKQSDGQSVVDAFKEVFDLNTDNADLKKYKKPSPEMIKRLKGESI